MLVKSIRSRGDIFLKVGYLFDESNDNTVVFFNAVGMKLETLATVARRFYDQGINFITWEHRSSPGQYSNDDDHTMQAQLDDADSVMSLFKSQAVTIFGWCTGASIAVNYLSRHPSVASGVVLIDGAFLFDGVPGGDLGNAMFEMCNLIEQDVALLDYFHKATAPNEQKNKTLGLDDSKWLIPLVLYPYMGTQNRLLNYAKAIVHSCSFDPTDKIKSIQCPTLFIGNKSDRMVSFNKALMAANLSMNGQVHIAEEGGHYNFFVDKFVQDLAINFTLSKTIGEIHSKGEVLRA